MAPPRIGLREPVVTVLPPPPPVVDEATAPNTPAPPPATTQEAPPSTVSQESKDGAHARFKNDPRARMVEHNVRSAEAFRDHASAAHVGAVPPPRPAASTFTDVDKAADAIEAKFGVHITDRSSWSVEELSRVHEAWSQLASPAETDKLKGLDLVRRGQATAEEEASNKGDGKIAGIYDPHINKDGPRTDQPSITYFDAAFPKPLGTDDSRRASQHVILHEAGHAVEGRTRDEAMQANNEAIAANNPNAVATQTTSRDVRDALPAVNKAAHKAKSKVHIAEIDAFDRANGAVNKAGGALANAKTPADLQKAQAAMDKALGDLDTAAAAMSPDNPAQAEFGSFAAKQHAYGDAMKAYGDTNVPRIATQKALDAVNTGGDVSTELKSFKAATRGEGPVSGYGGTASEENYAEAFALFKRDPDWLKAHNPKTYKWFAAHH